MTAILGLLGLTGKQAKIFALLGILSLIGVFCVWHQAQVRKHAAENYNRGYLARSAEVEEETQKLNERLRKVLEEQNRLAEEALTAKEKANELEIQLAEERALSDDDSAFSSERVLRYNRASTGSDPK